jgi:hypothetical protein
VYLMELTLYCMERAVEQGEGGIVTDYPDWCSLGLSSACHVNLLK